MIYSLHTNIVAVVLGLYCTDGVVKEDKISIDEEWIDES